MLVEVTPKVEADVLIGSLTTQAGREAEVPIPSSSEDGRTEVDVKVSAPGYTTKTRRVAVRANTTVPVRFTLQRAP